MTALEKEIRDYFDNTLSDISDLYNEYSDKALTFSYIMGMSPEECRYMEVEVDWEPDQIREWDEINSIVYRIQQEKWKNS